METTSTITPAGKLSWLRPALGLLIAIAVITAIILSRLPEVFSYLSLIPLMALFWYLERFSRAEMGFVWGRVRTYGLALLQPAFVAGFVALAAWIAGAIHIGSIDWPATVLSITVNVLVTILLAIGTEEGFFRGWLWASLTRAGLSKYWVVALTSLAISAWHLPVVLMMDEFKLPLAQAPIYIFNIVVTGVIMGVLRLVSGSVVVPSISHGVWNGVVYTLFGTGAQVGLLGIQESTIFRPEVGVLGLGLNLVLAVGLWLWYRRAGKMTGASQGLPAGAWAAPGRR